MAKIQIEKNIRTFMERNGANRNGMRRISRIE